MRIRKALAALAVGALTAAGASGCDPSGGQPSEEIEDCDTEDWANREAECGFIKPKTRPAATPGVKVPARPPAPRITRK